MIAWIMDGGGFRGIYSSGFASVLWPQYKPNRVDGVSIGALNAAKLVESGPAALERVWLEKIEPSGPKVFINRYRAVKRLISQWGKNPAFFDNDNLRKLIDEEMDVEKIAQSSIELNIVVTNESRGNRNELFSNHSLTEENHQQFREAILASASLMGAFPAVKIGQDFYSDGMNFDIEDVLNAGYTTIFILYNNHIWLTPAVSPETMDFNRRTRRLSSIYWSRMMEIYIELLLRRHEDLVIWDHSSLPQAIRDVVARVGQRQYSSASKRLILVGPTSVIPTLFILGYNSGDLTRGSDNAKKVAEKLLGEL